MKWQKFNIIIKHIEVIIGIWLLSRLIWVMLLIGIQLKDTETVISNLLIIMRALAQKLRIKL